MSVDGSEGGGWAGRVAFYVRIRIGFNADPDPVFLPHADQDPGNQTNADPDPDPGQTLPSQKKLDFDKREIMS